MSINSKIIKTILFLFILVFIMVSGLFYFGTRLPSLALPLKVVKSYALTDGGTIAIIIEDANRHQFLFGIEGNIEIPPEGFPIFIARWYPNLPIQMLLPKSGEQEKKLKMLLEKWITSVASIEDLEILKTRQVDRYNQINRDLLLIHQVYILLQERN